MRMHLKLPSDNTVFMILLLFLALFICITQKFNSKFILMKNLLLSLSKTAAAKKPYPNGVRRRRYEEECENQSGECSVCLCDFRRSDEIMQLPCDHIFHALCLDKWLVSYGHLTCPFCRASLSMSSSSSSSSSSRSSSTTPVLYSESEAGVISFNFFSSPSSRPRNCWGVR
ncbi:RING-type domain-containing protein [Heracleum sosnowskyi]|uniref:RING-type domain-containing protein n=1 Tax=Heracleum sosnowskyi TaxID=360622 RepID=A0AAD8I8J2_9APIA|nr:RING-type domain-containing protein [Heracleum sosnowskyi]